jgi:putative ABC transport system permease protein
MFLNYLKTTLRNFLKNKLFSVINIFGLSIGLSCSILILLAVFDELNYDTFHENHKSIYRVLQDMPFTEKVTWGITQGPLGPVLIEEIPEIDLMTRLAYCGWTMKYDDQELYSRGIYVDTTFLSIFSFKLIKGNPENVLLHPHSVILTEELAHKIFGVKIPWVKPSGYIMNMISL